MSYRPARTSLAPLDFLKTVCRHFFLNIIRLTPPIRTEKGGSVELHTLTSHQHVLLAILALKSFLRFYNKIAVVIHDDGTLNSQDKRLIAKHIVGARIIDNVTAETFASECLRKYPAAQTFRAQRINLRQTFDFNLLAQAKKVVALDSDILFFKYPKEVVEWIENENDEILYAYEKRPAAPAHSSNGIRITEEQNQTPFRFVEHLCCGFVCYYPDMFDLGLVDSYCQFVLKNYDTLLFYSQTIYALTAAHSEYSARILSPSYQHRPHFQPDPIFRHYWLSDQSWRPYYKDAFLVIKELCARKN